MLTLNLGEAAQDLVPGPWTSWYSRSKPHLC